MSGSNSFRPVPYVRIVHQPTPVYRMRYKAEKRTTFLLAENATANDQTVATSAAAAAASSSTTAAATNSKSKAAVRKTKGGGLSSDVPGILILINIPFHFPYQECMEKKSPI